MKPRYWAGLEDMRREQPWQRLEVQGRVPAWLSGSLLRTGPARYRLGRQSYRHWFDGLAALHCFHLREGEAHYACRWVDSPDFGAAEKDGRIGYPAFASDPCRSLFRIFLSFFKPDQTANPNVNVVGLEREWAAFTETPMPIRFDPKTLETLGVIRYQDRVGSQLALAHPLPSPDGRGLVNLQIRFGRRPYYEVVEQNFRRRRSLRKVACQQPAYMHSFAMADRDVVFLEAPLRVAPLRLLFRSRPFIENFRWKAELPSRFHWLDENGEAHVFEAEPMFCFHFVKAWKEGGERFVDLVTFEDAEVIRSFYLDWMERGGPIPDARLQRYHLHRGRAEKVWQCPEVFELPRSDGRYYFGVGVAAEERGDMFNQLVRVDPMSGETRTWREPGCYPGEPVWVGEPGGREGVVLSVVLDPSVPGSYLLVLDSESWTERARMWAPQAVPLGFHGDWGWD